MDEEQTADPAQRRRLLDAAVRETRAVYRLADAAYRPFGCPSSGECCQLSRTGRPPWLWPSEWEVLARHLAKAGRRVPPAREDGGCALLDASGVRCSVYEDRPFGCRTFFCGRRSGPAREPAERVGALLSRLEGIALKTGTQGGGPRPLPEYLEEARRT